MSECIFLPGFLSVNLFQQALGSLIYYSFSGPPQGDLITSKGLWRLPKPLFTPFRFGRIEVPTGHKIFCFFGFVLVPSLGLVPFFLGSLWDFLCSPGSNFIPPFCLGLSIVGPVRPKNHPPSTTLSLSCTFIGDLFFSILLAVFLLWQLALDFSS